MGPRGPRPTPSRVKEIQGNAGKRPLNKNEPKPLPSIPECPAHLDEEARAEWDRIAPELHRLQILARIDRAALAAYCQSWSRWIDAEKNYPIQSPYLSIANTAIDQMRRFLTEFGMSPSSRSRINAIEATVQPTDAWDDLDEPDEEDLVQ
jgi:phage terminase small subunit